jgi:hypothetical protein
MRSPADGGRNGVAAAAGASPTAAIAPYIIPAPPVTPRPFMNDLRVTVTGTDRGQCLRRIG